EFRRVLFRSHVEDPGCNSGVLDRFDCFRQAGPSPRRWRKLSESGNRSECNRPARYQYKDSQTLKMEIHATSHRKAAQNSYCEPGTVDCEHLKCDRLTSRTRIRNAKAPRLFSGNPHFRVG